MDRQPKEIPPIVPMVASRPSEEMFQALKRHIMKERQKKKQEQEADAEVERQRKERELKQKQDDMTLGENLEQITQLEQVLARLKDEKHQLFLQLKKVLNEDDNRRRLVRQQESCEVADIYSGMYATSMNPMDTHISSAVITPNFTISDRSQLYKVSPGGPTLLPPRQDLPPGSLKRARSPSPPPLQPAFSSTYSHPHGHKSPAPRVSYSSGAPVYSYGSTAQYVQSPIASRNDGGAATPPHSKHPIYLPQGIPRSQHKMGYPDDKFYPIIRPTSHVPIHGGGIPIQQQAQGVKTGGITSGYPIRTPSSSAPSPMRNVSSTAPNVYACPPNNSRLTHPQVPSSSGRYIQREV